MSRVTAEILLTTAHVTQWAKDVARLDAEIAERIEQRGKLIARLDAARVIAEDAEGTPAPRAKRATVRKAKALRKVGRNRAASLPTWTDEIASLIQGYVNGLSYAAVKAGLARGPLGSRLAASEKGFYGAIAKLETAGRLVKHNGYLFEPGKYLEFHQRVKDGVLDDIPPPSQQPRKSVMGGAILTFINGYPLGVMPGDIVAEMKKYPEFKDVVTKNKTSVYNVLKRLIDRNQIRKSGGMYLPALVNEPSKGKPRDGSETGEAPTSLFESLKP